ncbi:MAG: hypothetical protein WCE80_01855 [Acidimicrobiia bacterium]
MRSLRPALAALLLLGVTACAKGGSDVTMSDITGAWGLTEVDDAPVVVGVDAGRAPWVGIYSFLWWQRMEGDDGCNTFLARDLSFSEPVLLPKDTVTTTRRCLDEQGVDFTATGSFDRVFYSEQGITIKLVKDQMIWEDDATTRTFQRVDEVP